MGEEAENRYGVGAIYGSLAYDFDHPELYADGEEYSRPLEPAARPETETRTRVQTRTRAVPRTKQGLSLFALAGTLVAAFLLVIAISARVGLVSLSGESVELEARLSELEEEQARLRISYESAFNLAEIERYAMDTLGMRKPNASQVEYIDTSAPDRAVVIGGNESDSLVDRAADFLTGIGAYFQ